MFLSTESTPFSMKPGFAAFARILAWMPRIVRCWLAERSKSPRSSALRIRENATAPYPPTFWDPFLKPCGRRYGSENAIGEVTVIGPMVSTMCRSPQKLLTIT